MNNWVYIALMALTIFAIRVLPLTLIRKQIKSEFIKSFLHYVPYVTLSVMTFPAILSESGSVLAGSIALVAGCIAAWKKLPMFVVAIICCAIVLVFQFLPAI